MLTEEEKAYFKATFQRDVTNEQLLAGFQVSGNLIDLPAGPLGIAIDSSVVCETVSQEQEGER